MTAKEDHEAELNRINAGISRAIKESLPEGVGFALLVFDLGDGGFMTYGSNARRSDMVRAMRELLGVLERRGEG